MDKSIFHISKMDCPAEENLIRMKLQEVPGIYKLDFDLNQRYLTVHHEGRISEIEGLLHELNLGSAIIKTDTDITGNVEFVENAEQRKLLWIVLSINFSFFIIEIFFGLVSGSMGLVADSLDMLADSFVYGLSLLAVGTALVRKKRIAKIAGYFQITLAAAGFFEVLRRFFGVGSVPDYSTMIIVSIFALFANVICLYLLQKSKSKEEAHMKASMIFTSNDVIINLGVVIAGTLVHFLRSNKPDLIIGTIVFILVIQGAIRILKLGK